jgi:hypothetical protein
MLHRHKGRLETPVLHIQIGSVTCRLDKDKLAALNQEWYSPAAEMLMFRWKGCEQTPRTGMQRDRIRILFPVCQPHQHVHVGVHIAYSS